MESKRANDGDKRKRQYHQLHQPDYDVRGTGQIQSAVLNTDFSLDPRESPTKTSVIYLSPGQINEPLPGSKLIAELSQVNSCDWQERDEAVTLICSSMTNSHNESLVIQRGTLARGESVFIYQHMHAHRHEHVPPALFSMSFICFSSYKEHYFQ